MLSCQVLAARRRHCRNSPHSATQRDRNTQTFLPQLSGSLRPLCLNDVHEGGSLNCRQTGCLCLRWTLTPPWTSAQAARHRQVHSHLSRAEFEDGKQFRCIHKQKRKHGKLTENVGENETISSSCLLFAMRKSSSEAFSWDCEWGSRQHRDVSTSFQKS